MYPFVNSYKYSVPVKKPQYIHNHTGLVEIRQDKCITTLVIQPGSVGINYSTKSKYLDFHQTAIRQFEIAFLYKVVLLQEYSRTETAEKLVVHRNTPRNQVNSMKEEFTEMLDILFIMFE